MLRQKEMKGNHFKGKYTAFMQLNFLSKSLWQQAFGSTLAAREHTGG
jgi:hypothetical protein